MTYAAATAWVTHEIAEALAPPPQLTVSEWADATRILPRETSSEHGPWRTGRVPFTREIMDSLSANDPIRMVVLMKASQIAGSEIGFNWDGYAIEHDPSSILIVVPSFEFAKKFSKRRIRPLIETCPKIKAVVSSPRSREGGNTVFQKDYPGGSLTIASANSPDSLASDPVRRIHLDEVDSYPPSSGDEGSPLALAETRTTTFWNAKIYAVSSPRNQADSQIEPAFLAGDMRRFYVPCLHCGRMDFLTWRGDDPFKVVEGQHFRIWWPDGRPDEAVLVCPECGALTDEGEKTEFLARGEWRATAAGDGKTRSYHLPGMYSPYGWLSWGKMANEFTRASEQAKRGALELLKTYVNTRLGETWKEPGETIEQKSLLARAERWPFAPPDGLGAPVPPGVGVLVAAVDVQDDRLEALVTGFGGGEEAWVIDHRAFHGDPESEALWFELDAYLLRRWRHASGRELQVTCAVIDSGGHHSEQVYEFCKPRIGRRVFAVHGIGDMGKQLVGKATYGNKLRTPLFPLCVDTGKDRVYSRFKIRSAGPGYYHFPAAPWFDEEFVAQLTSESKQRKHVKGRGSVPFWKKLRERNEALDLTVYSLAALYILGGPFIERLGELAASLAAPLPEPGAEPRAEEQEDQQPPPASPSGSFPITPTSRTSWVTGWRG